jgi:hypothetical protein
MNNFQIDMAFKNYKNDVWYLKLAFTSMVMKIHKMDYMVSLPTVDFISIYLLDNGPLYWDVLPFTIRRKSPLHVSLSNCCTYNPTKSHMFFPRTNWELRGEWLLLT